MKILIDTHALLWIISDSRQLSKKAKEFFFDPKNKLFFSAASFWEISIKISLGKLQLKDNWPKQIEKELDYNGIAWLPIEKKHCIKVAELPFHHRDPFDRLLISQSIVEKMALMSADNKIALYDINIIW